MSVIVNRSRRQFLVGTGGTVLALPVLTSLLPKQARAQATAQATRPCFVCFATDHGAVREGNMYPADRPASERFQLYSDHEVRRTDLTLEGRSISPVLSAGALTPELVRKMNVIRGLDLPWNLGHHTGGYLGNFARNDGNVRAEDACPTIDQIMAESQSFYPETPKQKGMYIGLDGNRAVSWSYADVRNRSGAQAVPTSHSSKDLFDSLFMGMNRQQQQSSRTPLVDHVRNSYAQLRNGAFGDAKRLSKADRDRLDQHMDRISELQKRVNATTSCNTVNEPSRVVDKNSEGFEAGTLKIDLTREFYQTFNDVIVAGFSCGASRIATIHPNYIAAYAGDWHQDIAHTAQNNDGTQGTLTEANQRFFEWLFVDLMTKLDAVQMPGGGTLLDATLMMWGQESGPSTHDPIGMPIVTAGSASGYLRTGSYIDYRNLNARQWMRQLHPGVLYNQWLANVLMAMNIPPSEFELRGEKGYGFHHSVPSYGDITPSDLWPDRLKNDSSKVLPFLRAG